MMAEALTRKEIIQSIWNKIMAIIGRKDISKIGDGTVTGAIATLNSNLIYESIIFTASNENYRYFEKSGYCLIAAINGDWTAQTFTVTGIAHHNGNNLVYFSKQINGKARINCLWAMLDY